MDSKAEALVFKDEQWLQQLMASILDLHETKSLCDVTITDRDGATSMAHSCILAGSSPVFCSMLKASPKMPRRCQLGVNTNTVKHVLEFIYTGKVDIPDFSSLTQVFVLASELQIQPLIDWCSALGITSEGSLSTDSILSNSQGNHIFESSLTEIVADVKTEMGVNEGSDDKHCQEEPGSRNAIPQGSDSEGETIASPEDIAVKEEMNRESDEESHPAKETKSIGARVRKRGSISCPVCNKTFRYATHLKAHKKKHVDPYAYYCDVCNQEFATMAVFKVHQARHAQKLYTCEECGLGFKWPGSLQKHWKSHPDWNPYPCKMCSERFMTGKELKAHKNKVHHGKYKCKVCDKELTTTGKLTEHMLRHLNARNYICCICAARFNTKSQLTQHEALHQGVKRFKCDQCPKTCGSLRHLEEHKLSHSTEKAYECQYCGKRQKYLSGLRAHEKIHTIGKTRTCETCGKKFATGSQLKQHMTRHTGEKPYKCQLCGQRFTCASAKKRHEFAHTGLRPFPCNTCGKTFADKRDVRAHEKIHATEKPEQCQQCGKCFHTAGGLKAHKRTHQDADRLLYFCSMCDKSFMRSHNRNLHEVKVHGLMTKKRYQVPVLNITQQQQQQQEQQPVDTMATIPGLIDAESHPLNTFDPHTVTYVTSVQNQGPYVSREEM